MATPSSYVRVDSNLAGNKKILSADDSLYLELAGLYILILGHCDLGSTDGYISERAIVGSRGIAPGRDDLLAELLRVELAKSIGDGELWIPDYLDWQRSSDDKLSASVRARKAAKKKHASTDAKPHAETDAGTHAETHTEPHAETDASTHADRDKKIDRDKEIETAPARSLANMPECLKAEHEGKPLTTLLLDELGDIFGPSWTMRQANLGKIGKALKEGCPAGCDGSCAVDCAEATAVLADKHADALGLFFHCLANDPRPWAERSAT